MHYYGLPINADLERCIANSTVLLSTVEYEYALRICMSSSLHGIANISVQNNDRKDLKSHHGTVWKENKATLLGSKILLQYSISIRAVTLQYTL